MKDKETRQTYNKNSKKMYVKKNPVLHETELERINN